jgi:phosphoglycerol transferase MdoB-like AlkP superfamily enzyme
MSVGEKSERLLLTLWVGSLWAIGYLAVPMAFINLNDVPLAADYAGQLFFAVNVLGIGCGVVLIISKLIQSKAKAMKSWRFFVLMLMFILSIVFITYLLPETNQIRQSAWRTDQVLINQFDWLHSLSENAYLMLSLLGLALILSTDKSSAGNSNGAQ